ncbi:MAG: glycosyltransferase [Verrucomicrobiota bacterium]|nr:glycosyltransferase [Verrucomicrobiota bacterium]
MAVVYSIIVPAYNEEAMLPRTLAALKKAVQALPASHEIIVVNDASTDNTLQVAQDHGARVISVECRQIAAVRNRGAAIASGEILLFVDADTIVPPETLVAMAEALKNDIVGGGAAMRFDSKPQFWARIFTSIFLSLYFLNKNAAGCFIFVRRTAFDKVGGFNERYFAGEEVHLSQSLKKIGRMQILKEPVTTSARKFRMKSLACFLQLFFHLVRTGKKGWEKRDGLGMWYDGQRETPSAVSSLPRK